MSTPERSENVKKKKFQEKTKISNFHETPFGT
jgi:hypothetical protein